MQRNIRSVIARILAIAIVVVAVGIQGSTVFALSLTSLSDVMSREEASTASNHEIKFVTPTGGGVAAGESISLTFSADFTGVASLDFGDADFAIGDSNNCTTANFSEQTLAGTPSGATWGLTTSGSVVTLLSGTGTVTADRCVRFELGTNAATGGAGDTQISNGAADDDDTITVGGTFGDTGTITVDIIDSDQVTTTATVNQSLTFDLDTSVADGETSSPYSVAFGTVTVTDTRVSGTTDSINMIIAEVDTNATGGAVVTVRNANGANGMVSTSVPADNIGSADGTMADGTENYGLCVISVTQTSGALSKASPYNSGTCATNSETNDIQGLTTTGENILNTGAAPIAGGHAEISANAAVSGVTVAHSDYTDTLTFIATSTF
jgi:hypothetical protein